MSSLPDLTSQRLALGRAAVLTISQAAQLLYGRDADNRAAIRAAGITRWHLGVEVVVWGDVIDCVLSAASNRGNR